jgi:hypothetical protein
LETGIPGRYKEMAERLCLIMESGGDEGVTTQAILDAFEGRVPDADMAAFRQILRCVGTRGGSGMWKLR